MSCENTLGGWVVFISEEETGLLEVGAVLGQKQMPLDARLSLARFPYLAADRRGRTEKKAAQSDKENWLGVQWYRSVTGFAKLCKALQRK